MGRKEQRKREEIKTDEPTYEKKKTKKIKLSITIPAYLKIVYLIPI
jgi:hypothetical protein